VKHARNGSVPLGVAAFAAALALLAGGAFAQPTSVGLSTVRSQRFGNDNLSGIFTPQQDDQFGYAFAVGDFNGDGADDLATGMPLDDGPTDNPLADSGSVVVRYSTVGDGLTTNPSQVYIRQAAPVDPPDSGDGFGYALAACDVNHDGKDDLAIGIPGEDHLGRSNAGAVELHLGTSSGLATVAQVFFTESTDHVPGAVEEGDSFGTSLACGDFDHDTFDDLVVGVPDEDFETSPFDVDNDGAGMAVIIPGVGGGLDFARATAMHQGVDGIAGDPQFSDFFGAELAVGEFNGDAFDDLAVGVPGEDGMTGVVQIIFGSAGGLAADGNVMWSQSDLGGSSESGDYFGSVLAAGDFDGDGVDDVAIGVPREDFGSTSNVGQVHVVYGFDGGPPDPATAEIWTQDNVLFVGSSEAYDLFGGDLAAGDFDHDGHDDLAIGSPFEIVSGYDDGMVVILMGTADGLSAARRRAIAAGVDGFPGNALEHDKAYGLELAAGDFDGDGYADLAIGAPHEDDPPTGVTDVGSETVLYGSLFADGVENGDTGFWSQTVSANSNRVKVTAAAKLGPKTSKLGLELVLTGPTPRQPGPPVYVRVGPEAGLLNETHLAGTFFVDPRALSMDAFPGSPGPPPVPARNVFRMMAFKDGRDITRLTFELNRNTSTPGPIGGWALLATYFNETTGALTFANGAGFAGLNEPPGTNHRIDFDWTAGDPGQLTVWHTTYVDGVPDRTGRVQLFSVALPGMRNAAISNVLAGMVEGQDEGTFGSLYLDELSFRR